MSRVTLHVLISAPKERLAAIMQAVRNMEQQAPDEIAVSISVDARQYSVEEMQAVLIDSVNPPFAIKRIIRAPDGRREVVDP